MCVCVCVEEECRLAPSHSAKYLSVTFGALVTCVCECVCVCLRSVVQQLVYCHQSPPGNQTCVCVCVCVRCCVCSGVATPGPIRA